MTGFKPIVCEIKTSIQYLMTGFEPMATQSWIFYAKHFSRAQPSAFLINDSF